MENSLRSSVECVPEVAAGLAGRASIIVDGGYRRGTDIFKALARIARTVREQHGGRHERSPSDRRPALRSTPFPAPEMCDDRLRQQAGPAARAGGPVDEGEQPGE